jgi:hypothetical protein
MNHTWREHRLKNCIGEEGKKKKGILRQESCVNVK